MEQHSKKKPANEAIMAKGARDVNAHTTVPSSQREGGDGMQAFLSVAAYSLGLYAFNWQLNALSAVSNREIIDLLGWKNARPSEVILWTLIVLTVVIGALHGVLYLHQSHRDNAPLSAWFPGRIKDHQIPDKLGFLRVLAFVFLLAAPTVTQCFWVGRLFDHMQIVWKPAEETRLLKGTQMLTFPSFKDGDKEAGVFDSDWRWRYWYDEKAEELAGRDPAKNPVRPNAWPGVQPWLFLLSGIALAFSLLLLIARAIRIELLREEPTPANT